jgi:hypothetical protein
MLADIAERCNTIEESYEFMLAYAAQGLPSEEGSKAGAQIREFLNRVVKAISGLTESCAITVKQNGLTTPVSLPTLSTPGPPNSHNSSKAR